MNALVIPRGTLIEQIIDLFMADSGSSTQKPYELDFFQEIIAIHFPTGLAVEFYDRNL